MSANAILPVNEVEDTEHIIAPSYVRGLQTAIWVLDINNTKVEWANDAALELWNAKTLDEFRSRDIDKSMYVAIAQRLEQYQDDYLKSAQSFSEMLTVYQNGHPKILEVTFSVCRLPYGGMGLLCEAISKQLETPDDARSAEALLHTPVMISLYDQKGTPLYLNPAARASQSDQLNGIQERFVQQSEFFKLKGQLKLNGKCQISAKMRTAEGIRWHEITACECIDPVTGSRAILVSEINIKELKAAEQRARFLADHDVLTGLPNRSFVNTIIPKKLNSAIEFGEKLALLLIDLDCFKVINDTLGHAAGDELLIQVSNRLLTITNEMGMVARLGGDEFFICLSNVGGQKEIDDFCSKLVKEFQTSFTISGKQVHSTLSVGVSRFPEDAQNIQDLLKYADLAMYEAKHEGRNTYSCFSNALKEKFEEQTSLERDLRHAMDADQFELFYKPRLDVFTNEIIGVEALIRWNHPSRGVLTPDSFIKTAEDTGLIEGIGEWIIQQAAVEQNYLEQNGFPITVSINLSSKQLNSASMLRNVLSLEEQTGCNPNKIELEFTGSAIFKDEKNITDHLETLHKRGFRIALDDFGTGYSSLSHIQNYPVTSLKIDRSFINDIESNAEITQMIIALCKLLNIKPIAAGVETEEQLSWLRKNGCMEYQGSLFSPPLKRVEFLKLLTSPNHAIGIDVGS